MCTELQHLDTRLCAHAGTALDSELTQVCDNNFYLTRLCNQELAQLHYEI